MVGSSGGAASQLRNRLTTSVISRPVSIQRQKLRMHSKVCGIKKKKKRHQGNPANGSQLNLIYLSNIRFYLSKAFYNILWPRLWAGPHPTVLPNEGERPLHQHPTAAPLPPLAGRCRCSQIDSAVSLLLCFAVSASLSWVVFKWRRWLTALFSPCVGPSGPLSCKSLLKPRPDKQEICQRSPAHKATSAMPDAHHCMAV